MRSPSVSPTAPVSWLTDRRAIVLMLILTPLAFWNVLIDPGRCLQEDIALEWQGLHAAANEQIADGRFPHWNPYTLGGVRLFADTYLGLLYPGSALFRVLPFAPACVASWIIHYIATVIATYALARGVLGVQPAAALLAAWVFGLGGFSLGHCNHLNFVFALPWMPIMLLALHRMRERPRAGGLVVCACTACMWLAGGAPIFLMTVLAAVLLYSIQCGQDLARGRWRDTARWIGCAAVAIALGLGIAAVQIIPTIDFYGESVRSTWGVGRLSWGSLPWRTLLFQVLSPHILGNLAVGLWGGAGHETLFFVGGIATALAAIGACCRRRSAWIAPLLILLAVSVVLAHGNNPAARLFSETLGRIAKFREPSRFVCLIQLAVALLAAIGLQRLLESPTRTRFACEWAALLVFVAMTMHTLFRQHWLGGMAEYQYDAAVWKAAQPGGLRDWLSASSPNALLAAARDRPAWLTAGMILACGGGLIAFLLRRAATSANRRAMVILPLVLAELAIFGAGTWAGRPRMAADVRADHPIVRFLQKNLGHARYAAPLDFIPLAGNRGAMYGLANDRGYLGNSLNVSHAHEAFMQALGESDAAKRMFSTLFTVVKGKGSLDEPTQDGWSIRETTRPMMPISLIPSVRSMLQADMLQRMAATDFDPRHKGFVSDVTTSVAGEPLESSENCDLTKWRAGELAVRAQCNHPRWLCINISFDRGWHATVDDTPAKLHRFNACFCGLQLNKGQHAIALRYETPGLNKGALISVASVIALAALYLWTRRRLP